VTPRSGIDWVSSFEQNAPHFLRVGSNIHLFYPENALLKERAYRKGSADTEHKEKYCTYFLHMWIPLQGSLACMDFLGKRMLSAATDINSLAFVDPIEGLTAPRKQSTAFSNGIS